MNQNVGAIRYVLDVKVLPEGLTYPGDNWILAVRDAALKASIFAPGQF